MKKILKTLLASIPFKKQVFNVVKVLFHPSEKVFRHLHFKGKIKVKVNSDLSFKMYHYGFQVENEIFWKGLFGGWESDSLKIWSKLCENAKVICDVGANTGVYALLAKAINKESRVIAFEPVKRVYEKLLKNIEMNGFTIESSVFALSNYNGKADIYDTLSEHTYSVTVNTKTQDEDIATIKTEIDVIRLDTFCELNQIGKIDLMKIDVETHEPEVLEGYGDLLKNHRPVVLIEILSDEIGERVMKYFIDMHYCYFSVQENGVIEKKLSITRGKQWNFLLCPQELSGEIELMLKHFFRIIDPS